MKKRLLPFILTIVLLAHQPIFSQVWTPKAINVLPSNYSVSAISIVSEQVIWATAIDFSQVTSPVPATHLIKLMRSKDGGETWQVQDIEEAMGRISWDIHAFDENSAIITSQNLQNARGLWLTTDAGNTWTQVLSGNAGSTRVHFFDGQEGVSIQLSSIAKSANGGQTWTNIPNVPTALPGEFQSNLSFATSGNTVWFGTSAGRVFKGKNNGLDWTAIEAELGSSASISSIAFTSEYDGLCIYGASLAKTTDGGSTWESIGSTEFDEVYAIPCTNTFMGISRFTFQTSVSTDHGATWTQVDVGYAGRRPVFLNPEFGWMANAFPAFTGAALLKWAGGSLDRRIYVNQNATGANTGLTWADAFTDLQDAIAGAEEGDEIWVAEGTYKPAAPGSSLSATFLINENLKLYGGFAGNECNLSERNPVAHPTILSGDLNGDDVDDDFINFKSDNVQTVMTVNSNITTETRIDGFTIRGGHANGTGNDLSPARSGGGLYSTGFPLLQHCHFQQNFAAFWGGGAYFAYSGDQVLEINHCTFVDNKSVRGGGLNIIDSNCMVADCTFQSNIASQYGGGFWYRNEVGNQSAEVTGCTFLNNQSSFGGGLRLQHSSLQFPNAGNNSFLIADCIFTGNAATVLPGGYPSKGGGGLNIATYPNTNDASITVRNCHFSEDTSVMVGGALYFNFAGDSSDAVIDSCSFQQNNTEDYGTVAIEGIGSGNIFVKNSLFESNIAGSSAGLDIYIPSNAEFFEFEVTDCRFGNNQATQWGGGLGLFAESASKITLDRNYLEGNSAGGSAGAIWLTVNHPSAEVKGSNLEIIGNISPTGAAIAAISAANVPVSDTANISFENCLMAGNMAEGATLEISEKGNVGLLNCTIANNEAHGVATFNSSALSLQNTILFNPGKLEYQDLTGDCILTSKGGNLVGDNSIPSPALSDIVNSDPKFMGSGNYQLSEDSPCVDAGINDGVTAAHDLGGNVRIQGNRVDIGAFESPFVVNSTQEVVVGELVVSPNPASHFLNIQLPEAVTVPLNVQLFDASGRSLRSQKMVDRQSLDLNEFESGFYFLKVVIGEQIFVGKFIKQ